MNKNSFVLKKNKTNEILIELETDLLKLAFNKLIKKFLIIPFFKLINHFYSFLEVIFQTKLYLGIIMSLGLGLGIGLTIYKQPSSASASSQLLVSKTVGIEIKNISFSDIKLAVKESNLNSSDHFINRSRNIAFHQKNSSEIGSSGSIIIFLARNFYQELRNLELGEEIALFGENNGQYGYTIVGIKQLDKNEINSFDSFSSETVVVLAPKGLFSNELYAVIARPQS
ncbi:MAG: hypothetical protein PVJ09_04885 [Candidatus Woesebacteria bacterium]|jgi:hypothetical protein